MQAKLDNPNGMISTPGPHLTVPTGPAASRTNKPNMTHPNTVIGTPTNDRESPPPQRRPRSPVNTGNGEAQIPLPINVKTEVIPTNTETRERFLTPSQVAELLNVHTRTVRRWATSGLIGSIRTPGGHRRYREYDVNALIDRQHPAPRSNDDSHREISGKG
jgi:excisionase family DNA binding protein